MSDVVDRCETCQGYSWIYVNDGRSVECHNCKGTGKVNKGLIVEQPAPVPAQGDVWLQVIADMEKRRQHGISKYGTPVQVNNGRDHLRDLFEEVLDAAVYCKQHMEAIKDLKSQLIRLKDLCNEPMELSKDKDETIGKVSELLECLIHGHPVFVEK